MVIGEATLLLLTNHCMVFSLLSLDDTKGFLIVSEIWDFSHGSWNMIFGCNRTDTYMNIFLCVYITNKPWKVILRALLVILKTGISSR